MLQTLIPLQRLIKHPQWIQMEEKTTNQSVLNIKDPLNSIRGLCYKYRLAGWVGVCSVLTVTNSPFKVHYKLC